MKKTDIKNSLIKQLESKGAKVSHFEDMINDYMSLWDIKKLLLKDVKDRGVMYKDVSSVGYPMQKNNPSVGEIVKVNKQMLSILKEMVLTTETAGGGAEDDGL